MERRRLHLLHRQLAAGEAVRKLAQGDAAVAPRPAAAGAKKAPGAAGDAELPLLSWDTIRRHSMAQDAWVVIKGVVYDITAFIKDEGALSGHPGNVLSHLTVTALGPCPDRDGKCLSPT